MVAFLIVLLLVYLCSCISSFPGHVYSIINFASWVIFCNYVVIFVDFFKKNNSKSENSFRNTIRVLKSLDPDQDRRCVSADHGLNSL